MIKVHSVFPNDRPNREIAIQTEAPLPRIRLSHQKNKQRVMGQDHHLPLCGADGTKVFGMGGQMNVAFRATSYVTSKSKDYVLRRRRDRKENSCTSL